MILLLDNYDSFTYNLYQYLGEMGEEIVVYRNDELTLEQVESLKPDRIVLSPGPGRPSDAGSMNAIIEKFSPKIPMLGICLGFQGIGEVFGGKVVHAPELFHGKTSKIDHDGEGVFKVEVMPNLLGINDFIDDGQANLYVLKLPEGKYSFTNFHLKNSAFSVSPYRFDRIPFNVEKDKICYAGFIKISMSKDKRKGRIDHLNRFDRDAKILPKKIKQSELLEVKNYFN